MILLETNPSTVTYGKPKLACIMEYSGKNPFLNVYIQYNIALTLFSLKRYY